MIDIDYLKQLLELFDESSVNDLKIEKEGTAIRLTKNMKREATEGSSVHYVQAQTPPPPPPSDPTHSPPPPPQSKPEEVASGKEEELDGNYHEIRSPIVGTFYRAPNPESDPFVQVGDDISQGDVLCIVEAMKLMNEIESDVSGRVAKILVENAQPVEYNQVLFLIEQ